jgi:hypothetical protein
MDRALTLSSHHSPRPMTSAFQQRVAVVKRTKGFEMEAAQYWQDLSKGTCETKWPGSLPQHENFETLKLRFFFCRIKTCEEGPKVPGKLKVMTPSIFQYFISPYKHGLRPVLILWWKRPRKQKRFHFFILSVLILVKFPRKRNLFRDWDNITQWIAKTSDVFADSGCAKKFREKGVDQSKSLLLSSKRPTTYGTYHTATTTMPPPDGTPIRRHPTTSQASNLFEAERRHLGKNPDLLSLQLSGTEHERKSKESTRPF